LAAHGNTKQHRGEPGKPPVSDNKGILVACVCLVAAMVGMSYAAVPLYRLFCQVTGYAGTTRQVADASGVEVSDREITVRFDANTAPDLNWNFYPAQRSVHIKLGETTRINYFVENKSDRDLTGTATFNITPQGLGAYFNKIECFCFTKTEVKAGDKLEMPVVFFVDPDMAGTEEAEGINTLTLSYTFYPDREAQATLSRDNEKDKSRTPGG
jgi:cytochrome c oxidase assembly protein subunit 11